jgi:hypothetical protein
MMDLLRVLMICHSNLDGTMCTMRAAMIGIIHSLRYSYNDYPHISLNLDITLKAYLISGAG